jgi:spore coat protein SA
MDKIKVAVICSATARIMHENQGATQINAFEATRRYKRYEPYLFSASYAGAPDREDVDGVHLIRIKSDPASRIIFALRYFKDPNLYYVNKVAQEIKRLGIKIAHVRNRPAYVPYLRSLLGNGVKIVLHEHNQNIADTMNERTALKILEAIDAYVGVSKFTMDHEITKKYPQFKDKAHFILNAVDVERFKPIWEREKERIELRAKYGLQHSKAILFVGAIRERKGIHYLVRAMKEVVKKHPEAKLIIAGGSAMNVEPKDAFAGQVKAEAAGLGDKVVYLGFVSSSKIPDIYLLADIFVGPSIWEEPFGLVFAEASASGLPAIASRRGGIPEIIQNGVNGLLLDDPADINALAEKISSLLEDPRLCSEMGRNGRKIMTEKFSWSRVAREIEALYDKLLSVRTANE